MRKIRTILTLTLFVDRAFPLLQNSTHQWRIQKFWKRGRRKTMYQSRRHLSHMRTTNYMHFIPE